MFQRGLAERSLAGRSGILAVFGTASRRGISGLSRPSGGFWKIAGAIFPNSAPPRYLADGQLVLSKAAEGRLGDA